MDVKAIDVEKGMDVFGSDGEKVGTVAEVWAESDTHEPVERSTTHLSDYGPISGSSTPLDTARGYIRVTSGGVLGVGAQELYVPLTEVTAADRENGIQLGCASADCEARYKTKPDLFAAET